MDLLTLQGSIKRDPDGYVDEFRQQYRHYKACLEIFKLRPSKDSREFADLVNFVAQVASCYPKEVQGFVAELTGLLEDQAAALDPATRLSLVRALILLRNRGALTPLEVLPTLFRLFRCQDKALRQLLFRHIISDIKSANRKHRDNRLNRGVQAFLYNLLQGEEESSALRALAVLTELHRRNVWRDARTVNVIASATQHPSSRVMLAAIKFFLGQDEVEDAGSDDEEGGSRKRESGAPPPPTTPTAKDVYTATKKGTASSKRRKAAKLQRCMQAVKKHERRAAGSVSESFAAMQLLHDPQTFAERLFARLQKANERLETRLAMMAVISRAVGVHKLLLLNFYPFLQKYMQPHQRDVTQILAILVQAVHDLVPPETMAPVLKQLADQFINDRTRPEVMVVGLRAVRELTARSPLIMTADLLQDLAEYRKYKHKEVSSAARALVSQFRQLNPGLLAKKDRGRGADLETQPLQYGQAVVPDRIEGADLLQAAELRGSDDDDVSGSELELDSDGEGAELSDDGGAESDEEAAGSGEEAEEGGDAEGSEWESASEADLEGAEGSGEEAGGSDAEPPGSGSGEEGGGSGSGGESDEEEQAAEEDVAAAEAAEAGGGKKGRGVKRRAPGGQADSIQTLKKRLTGARAAAVEAAAADPEAEASVPLEWGRILTEEDFERIRELRHTKLVDDMMSKHGLKSKQVLNEKRMGRLREAVEEEAEEQLEAAAAAATRGDDRVRSQDLASKHKGRRTKEERMATVLEGREGREFGAAAGRKKNKTGGLSNRQQQKKKRMPGPARAAQLKRRAAGRPTGKAAKKAQRGHTGAGNFKHRNR